jgi:hypothetical protein
MYLACTVDALQMYFGKPTSKIAAPDKTQGLSDFKKTV